MLPRHQQTTHCIGEPCTPDLISHSVPPFSLRHLGKKLVGISLDLQNNSCSAPQFCIGPLLTGVLSSLPRSKHEKRSALPHPRARAKGSYYVSWIVERGNRCQLESTLHNKTHTRNASKSIDCLHCVTGCNGARDAHNRDSAAIATLYARPSCYS